MSKRTMKGTLALAAAGVLTFTAGAGAGTAYGAPTQYPSVQADTWGHAWSACNHAYGPDSDTPDVELFADCVNAASVYFYGAGHRVYWNA